MAATKTFRTFVTRHYIAVQWYDVRAVSAPEARRKAERAAHALLPDARADATDNGWHGDDPIIVKRIGQRATGRHAMRRVAPGVYAIAT